jgi:hypothetical protein
MELEKQRRMNDKLKKTLQTLIVNQKKKPAQI